MGRITYGVRRSVLVLIASVLLAACAAAPTPRPLLDQRDNGGFAGGLGGGGSWATPQK